MSRSAPITVIVETPSQEYWGDQADLITVEASTERERDGVLSDKEWFEEEWNSSGEYLLWEPGEIVEIGGRPGFGKRYKVVGTLWSEQDYWGEWDGGFDIDSCEEIGNEESKGW